MASEAHTPKSLDTDTAVALTFELESATWAVADAVREICEDAEASL